MFISSSPEITALMAELENELLENEITQKGYQKRKFAIQIRALDWELEKGEITNKGYEKQKKILMESQPQLSQQLFSNKALDSTITKTENIVPIPQRNQSQQPHSKPLLSVQTEIAKEISIVENNQQNNIKPNFNLDEYSYLSDLEKISTTPNNSWSQDLINNTTPLVVESTKSSESHRICQLITEQLKTSRRSHQNYPMARSVSGGQIFSQTRLNNGVMPSDHIRGIIQDSNLTPDSGRRSSSISDISNSNAWNPPPLEDSLSTIDSIYRNSTISKQSSVDYFDFSESQDNYYLEKTIINQDKLNVNLFSNPYFKGKSDEENLFKNNPYIPKPTYDSIKNISHICGNQKVPTERRGQTTLPIDEQSSTPLSSFNSILKILRFRAHLYEISEAITVLDSKGKVLVSTTFSKLNLKALKICQNIKEKPVTPLLPGTKIALIFTRHEVVDFVACMFGCFYAGMVAVPITTSSSTWRDVDQDVEEELKDIEYILESSEISFAFTSDSTFRTLTKDYTDSNNQNIEKSVLFSKVEFWKTGEFGLFSQKKGKEDVINFCTAADTPAYIEYTRNAVGILRGVVITHQTIMKQVSIAKVVNNLKTSDIVLSVLEPRQQFGLMHGIFLSIYNGNQFIYSIENICQVPGAWTKCIQKYKVTTAIIDQSKLICLLQSTLKHKEQLTTHKKPLQPFLKTLSTIILSSITPNVQIMTDILTMFIDFGIIYPRPDTQDIFIPVLSLDEFGGCILSWTDRQGVAFEKKLNPKQILASSTQSPTPNILSILIDRSEWRDEVVNVIGFTGDQKPDTETIFGLNQTVTSSTPVLILTSSGFAFPDLCVVIIHSETGGILPPNMVGEICVNAGFGGLPSSFFPASYMDDFQFRTVPLLFNGDISKGDDGFTVTSFEGSGTFLRTGLYGFLVDDTILGLPINAYQKVFQFPRIFVVGFKHERIRQRKIGFGKVEDQGDFVELVTPTNGVVVHSPRNFLARSSEFYYHYSGQLVDTVMTNVYGIENCVIFANYVNGEHLVIALIETSRPELELKKMSRKISDKLFESHNLELFSIVFCSKNTLPIYKSESSENSSTRVDKVGLSSSFIGYQNGIQTKLWAIDNQLNKKDGKSERNSTISNSRSSPEPPTQPEVIMLVKTKQVAIDVEMCKELYNGGRLCTNYTWLNPGVNVIKNIGKYETKNKTHSGEAVGQVWGSTFPTPILDKQQTLNGTTVQTDLVDLTTFPSITHLLMWRVEFFPEQTAFSLLDFKGKELLSMTLKKFSSRVHSLAHYLIEKKGVSHGDCVLVSIPHSIDYLISIHACFYAGIIAVPIQPPDSSTRLVEDVSLIMEIVQELGVDVMLVSAQVEETLKSKVASQTIKLALKKVEEAIEAGVSSVSINSTLKPTFKPFPQFVIPSKAPKLKKQMDQSDPVFLLWTHKKDVSARIATIHCFPTSESNVQQNKRKKLFSISHQSLLEQCRIQTIHCRMLESTLPNFNPDEEVYKRTKKFTSTPTKCPIVSCEDVYNGVGFLYSLMLNFYVGSLAVIIPPFEYSLNTQVLFETITRDLYTSYPMLKQVLNTLKIDEQKTISLHNLKGMMISTHGRTNSLIDSQISKKLKPFRLDKTSICPTYSPSINPMVSTRSHVTGTLSVTLWLDSKELSNRRIKVTKSKQTSIETKDDLKKLSLSTCSQISPNESISKKNGDVENLVVVVTDSGHIPNNTVVVIVDPLTGKICKHDEYGEVWVSSKANVDGKIVFNSKTMAWGQFKDPFNLTVEGLDPNLRFSRTGDYGFIWPVKTEKVHIDDEEEEEVVFSPLSVSTTSECGWKELVFSGKQYEMVLFILGNISISLGMNGLTYFPEDIEKTIQAANKLIIPNSCVLFQYFGDKQAERICCVVEISGNQSPVDLVPCIINRVLEHHQLLIHRVVFLGEGVAPRTRVNEKQRLLTRRLLELNQLAVIKVFEVDSEYSTKNN